MLLLKCFFLQNYITSLCSCSWWLPYAFCLLSRRQNIHVCRAKGFTSMVILLQICFIHHHSKITNLFSYKIYFKNLKLLKDVTINIPYPSNSEARSEIVKIISATENRSGFNYHIRWVLIWCMQFLCIQILIYLVEISNLWQLIPKIYQYFHISVY